MDVLSGSVAFSDETSNDTARCILRVEGIAQLLPGIVVLLSQSKGLQDEGVPFVLKGMEEGRDRGRGGGSWRCGLGVWSSVSASEEGVKDEYGLALTERRSDSSSFSPVRGSVPLSLMYLRMRRRS